jgi:AbiV family abortive infection protein
MVLELEHYDAGLVANFIRLLRDAELLRDHRRFASAYALAMIGLEEIAKIILTTWVREYPMMKLNLRRNQHLTKQAALTSLLLAEAISPSFDLIMAEKPEVSAAEFVRRWSESGDQDLLWRAHQEDLQKSKHLALYHDVSEGSSIRSDQFTHKEVDELFTYARRAVLLTADHRTMVLALAVFQVMKDVPSVLKPEVF